MLQTVKGLILKGKLTPHLVGRPARTASLVPGKLVRILDLRHAHILRRSDIVLACSFKLLIPLQHGSRREGLGFPMYPRHFDTLDNTLLHGREALVKGMFKTKDIIAKQVSLIRIGLPMIWKL